jgi:hypothetical protein
VTAVLAITGDLSLEESQGIDGGPSCPGATLAVVPPTSLFSHKGEVVSHSPCLPLDTLAI